MKTSGAWRFRVAVAVAVTGVGVLALAGARALRPRASVAVGPDAGAPLASVAPMEPRAPEVDAGDAGGVAPGCTSDEQCPATAVCTKGECAVLTVEEPEDDYPKAVPRVSKPRPKPRKKPSKPAPGKRPTRSESFDDADSLDPAFAQAEYTSLIGSLLRSEISGVQEGIFLRSFERAPEPERNRLRFAALDALTDPQLRGWIDAAPELVRRAERIATALTPADVAAAENEAVSAKVAAFADWKSYPYQIIIVPGFTPRDQRKAEPGVHPIGRLRIEEAKRAYDEKQAPFVLVSGGNVYPRGTPYHEGVEMKRVLVALGVPVESIYVDARARHSTTNLRNAGRFMVARGLERALITAPGGGVGPFDQAFYFAHPTRSTFNARCMRELGYRVGELREAGDHRAAYSPAKDVVRVNYRDPLDP